jgi:RNAse (barnase) inhibitor barstar
MALHPFVFEANLGDLDDEDFVAKLSSPISNREELFDELYRELRLPGYFGGNWDALSDCLRDLSWISARRVVIVHERVPTMDEEAMAMYLDVLDECVNDWKGDEQHELIVAFPPGSRERILAIHRTAGRKSGESLDGE